MNKSIDMADNTVAMRGARVQAIATRSQHLKKDLYENFVFAFKQDMVRRDILSKYNTPEAIALMAELNK